MPYPLQRCLAFLCLVVLFGAFCPRVQAAPASTDEKSAQASKSASAARSPTPSTTPSTKASTTPSPKTSPKAKAETAPSRKKAQAKPAKKEPSASEKSASRAKAASGKKTGKPAAKEASSSASQAAPKRTGKREQTAAERTDKKGKRAAAAESRPAKGAQKSASRPVVPASNFKGAVLYNVNANKVVFARNQNRLVPPASLTKILSMFVAEDAIRSRKIPRSTLVTVSHKAASASGSRMDLHAGQKVALEDLLRGMAISSGNDASIAVAEFIGGSEARFVDMMNKKARGIGMRSSTFKNCNGLPAKGQYTTAMDMLTLARRYMAAYPENLDKFHRHNVFMYNNHYTGNANPLLGNFQGADGLKTGFVSAAGYNLIATAERNKVRTIGVMLGCPSSAVRAREATSLMEAGFGSLACPLPPPKAVKKGSPAKEAPEKSAPDKRKKTRVAAAADDGGAVKTARAGTASGANTSANSKAAKAQASAKTTTTPKTQASAKGKTAKAQASAKTRPAPKAQASTGKTSSEAAAASSKIPDAVSARDAQSGYSTRGTALQ